jgi:hypothetical protein
MSQTYIINVILTSLYHIDIIYVVETICLKTSGHDTILEQGIHDSLADFGL